MKELGGTAYDGKGTVFDRNAGNGWDGCLCDGQRDPGVYIMAGRRGGAVLRRGPCPGLDLQGD